VFLEFCELQVWGHLRNRVVHMLFGNNLVNLANLFGGGPLCHVALENDCRVAAVSLVEGGGLLAATCDTRQVNHFVMLSPS
jgi:hypothetical protein